MSRLSARGLVFVVSAAVLVLEILAGRLLAPHVGVTLETYTAIIGVVLAGIAAGSWIGGLVADRVDPRRLLGPTILAGGALAIASVPVASSLGGGFEADIRLKSVVIAGAAFLLPALVLSAVNPMVVKLELHDLGHTGEVVGSFAGVGTFGALVGTFVTGFVLVAEAPTRTVVYAVGGFLALLGIGLWVWLGRRDVAVVGALMALTAGAGSYAARSHTPCDAESAYSCIRVESSPSDDNVRQLWLNEGLQGSVDLTDPTYLEAPYMRLFADAIQVAWNESEPLSALHVGGGAFVMPRYLTAIRPDSDNVVLELDPAVVELARDQLGLEPGPELAIRTGDARTSVRGVPADSMDLVIGDAFRGLTAPWHLMTREFVADVDRVLTADGVYLLNVIDSGDLAFTRAEIATLRERFEWVGAILRPPTLAGLASGNVVLVAAHRPLDAAALEELVSNDGYVLLGPHALEELSAGSKILTDDFAPVDQLLGSR